MSWVCGANGRSEDSHPPLLPPCPLPLTTPPFSTFLVAFFLFLLVHSQSNCSVLSIQFCLISCNVRTFGAIKLYTKAILCSKTGFNKKLVLIGWTLLYQCCNPVGTTSGENESILPAQVLRTGFFFINSPWIFSTFYRNFVQILQEVCLNSTEIFSRFYRNFL